MLSQDRPPIPAKDNKVSLVQDSEKYEVEFVFLEAEAVITELSTAFEVGATHLSRRYSLEGRDPLERHSQCKIERALPTWGARPT